ncbi:ABC transporter substrate-binding protein [Leucobacter sp. wl10]|uniref:ABC transporter substrate-binding protein n=1 Tax=Leucobacter sp. wl10 TaxID=2304677 RepID=UPI0013C36FB1|nr:ABC transporter substrate-binding protein [Leucobacter sp. wl10]
MLAGLIAVPLAMSGCTAGGGSAGSGAAAAETIVLAAQGEVPPLDPQRLTGTIGLRVSDAIYDTLVRENLSEATKGASKIAPALAESWEVSEDGLTYDFTIRGGVTFHDGTELTAEAVKLNFDRILDPDSPVYSETAAANMKFLTRWIASTSVKGTGEFTVTLSNSFPEFLGLLSDRRMGIISPKLLQTADEDQIAATPIGTGPYSTDGIVQGEDIQLERNADYWRGEPKTRRLLFTSISDANTMVSALQTRQIDVILSAGSAQVAQLKGDESVTVQYPDPANSYFIRLNTRAAGTDNKLVRQALNYAVDREGIAAVMNGQASPLPGAIPAGNRAWDPTVNDTYTYDPERAKTLLRQAGVDMPLQISIMAPSEGPGFSQARDVMSLVQEDFAKVGVELDVQFMEFTAMVAEESAGYADDIAGSFNGWTTGSELAYWLENMFSPDLIPPTGTNRGWYQNVELGNVFAQGRAELNDDARNAIYRQAAEIIDEDAPWVFLYQDRLPRAFAANVLGPVEAPSVYFDYSVLQKSE